jgi:hypothetical protein
VAIATLETAASPLHAYLIEMQFLFQRERIGYREKGIGYRGEGLGKRAPPIPLPL